MILSCVDAFLPSLSGLTYFLTTSQRDGESSSILDVYLQRCPECEHILQPLGWGKERRTHDVVSNTSGICLHTFTHGTQSIYRCVWPAHFLMHPKSSKIIPRSDIQKAYLVTYVSPVECLPPGSRFLIGKKCAWLLDCSLLKRLITWFITGQRSSCCRACFIYWFSQFRRLPWFLDWLSRKALITWFNFDSILIQITSASTRHL